MNDLPAVQLHMRSIGHAIGGRQEASKDGWGGNRCTLALDPTQFGPQALQGIGELSHVEVVFYFHANADEPVETGARHPRGRVDWPCVGIFAQRGRMRPNRIGTSICRVVEVREREIVVEGLDAVHGTPLLDIKPVWSEYLPRDPVRQPGWSRELMAHYW